MEERIIETGPPVTHTHVEAHVPSMYETNLFYRPPAIVAPSPTPPQPSFIAAAAPAPRVTIPDRVITMENAPPVYTGMSSPIPTIAMEPPPPPALAREMPAMI